MSGISDYNLATRSNPCPVCGATADCKEILARTQILWLCRANVSTPKGGKVPGADGQLWHCFGEDQSGVWGKLSPDRKQSFSELDRAEHDAELARKRVELERRRQEDLERELKEGGRDTAYQGMLGELELNEGDRSNLCDRGFTSEQIDAVGFRSVDKWQKVAGEYPKNLPGHNPKSKRLIVPRAGILCPVPNHEGLIVGWQVRFNEVHEGQQRYMWAKDAHLNGEQPIACWDKQSRHSDEIWAIEGTGIKPALAHFKHGYPVIGASGGLFESSAKNFRKTWEFLKNKYNTNKLVVAVDGGDVVNPNVVSRLERQFNLFNSLNIDVSIAWWGQAYKGKNDIDEIDDLDNVKRISVEDFRVILKQYKKERDNNKKTVALEPVKAERDTLIQKSSQKPLPVIPRPKQWSDWLTTRKYSADMVQSDKFIRFDAPAPGTILAVKSGLGSGKTHQLESLFEKGGAFEGKGAIALFARNSLVFNFVKRIPSFSHLNEEYSLLVKDPHSRLALCTNSLKKFVNPEWFDGKILVIDEFSSVAFHLACSSTHRKDRIDALEIWREAFVRCESVIILDGNLTDWQVEWAGKQAPGKKIVKLENNADRPKPKVEILLGTPTKGGKFDDTKLSPFAAAILASDTPTIIFSDSQKLLEQLEKLLILIGKKGLRIDSKTIKPKSEERLFLDDCNAWINANQPDYILLSPTAESGVDINNLKLNQRTIGGSYFPHSYGLFRGIVGTDSQMQMMARYRDENCFWHISVPKQSFLRGSDRDYDLATINAAAAKMMELSEMDISHLRLRKEWLGETFLQYIEQAHQEINNQFAFKYREKEKFEKDHLRECLIFALEDAGHEVSQSAYFADNRVEGLLKIAGEEVKEQVSKEIFEATDISEKEAEDIAASWSAVWEDRVKVIKAGYKKLLPGIEDTEVWTAEFIRYLKYDNPQAISGANLLYQFRNPEVAAKKQRNAWAKIATERAIFLPDFYSPFIKVKALQFLKLEQFLEPGKNWHKDSPEVLELVKAGNRKRIVQALGFAVPRITKGKRKGDFDAMRYLRKLIELVGLKLGPCQQIREGEKRFNQYALDDAWLADPLHLEISAAVGRRYEEFDREWEEPEILKQPVQQITCTPDIEIEPETDDGGVDWRGVVLQVKQAVGSWFAAGDYVEADGQPRDNGAGGWLIWVKSAIGRFQIDFEMLELAFD